MLMRLLRWLTRAQIYSATGMWYIPAIDMILPIVLGVNYRSITFALLAYFIIKSVAAVIGYWDVHYGKRIQYSNEFGTKLNPYLVNLISRNHRRIRNKVQAKARLMAAGVCGEPASASVAMLRKEDRENISDRV